MTYVCLFVFLAWFGSITIISEVKQQLLLFPLLIPHFNRQAQSRSHGNPCGFAKENSIARALSPFSFSWLNMIPFDSVPKQELDFRCVQTLPGRCWVGQDKEDASRGHRDEDRLQSGTEEGGPGRSAEVMFELGLEGRVGLVG